MVFVHARNATVKTALTLREMAANQGDSALFHAPQGPEYGQAEKQVRSQLGEAGWSTSDQLYALIQGAFSNNTV